MFKVIKEKFNIKLNKLTKMKTKNGIMFLILIIF